MGRTRWRSWWSAVIACAVVGLAACGPGPVGGDEAGRPIPESNPYGGNLAEEGEPVAGGTMRIGLSADVRGFDPTVQANNFVGFALYDSLLKYSPEGEPEPYLAESMETTDGGKTWILELRPDVRFHDGTPLNADAVIFNIERHASTPSSPGNFHTQRIESMTAVDDLTVEFVLTEPFGEFASVFAMTYVAGGLGIISSPTAIQRWGDEYAQHPVGAGPFKFVEWIPDNRIVLERNDDYWQEGLPYLDRLEFVPLPDTETRYASVENGDVDMIFGGYHTELIRAMDDPELTVYYGPGNGANFLHFNHRVPPFDDRRMREAIVRSINLEAMSATLYRGRMEAANSIFGPDSEYYSEAAGEAWPDYDPERARQLIEEYIADGGDPSFTFKSSNAPNRVQLGEFLQAQWAEVGLDVELEFIDLAQFVSGVVLEHDFQITSWASGPWDHPYSVVYSLFHSEGDGNYGGYSNPEMDRVMERAVETTDPNERIELYQRAQEIANRDIVAGWFSRGYFSTITQPEVRGVVRYLQQDMFYATLWLDR